MDVLCHTSGTIDIKLTYEHTPPLRVQKLVANSRYKRTNPISLINDKTREKRLPPARAYPRGLGRESLCERCQQLTQTHYGSAFFEWSAQALRLAEKVNPNEESVLFSVSIKPLAVIKQIITSLLATGDFLGTQAGIDLRKIIQNPRASSPISPFAIFAYLNPPDPDYALPQSRHNPTQYLVDVKGGPSVLCHSELAYPPMGYVMVWHEGLADLSNEVRGLTEITHFSTYGADEVLNRTIRLAVRTPFGPASLRYWQTARNEAA